MKLIATSTGEVERKISRELFCSPEGEGVDVEAASVRSHSR